jgi:serine/threonine protein kinase
MPMIRCDSDLQHFYNPEKHDSCPYCNEHGNVSGNVIPVPENKLIQGRYEIINEIGKGAFSKVFFSNDRALNRKVALKCFHQIKDPPTIARIQREATVWSKIKHSNIVNLYDILNHEGNLYLILEYVEGNNLDSIIEKQQLLEVKVAVKYAIDIFHILDYLHSKSIIHRDIKPSNLIINQDNCVVLTDFTTGKAISQSQTITGAGVQIGTPSYMSPEQGKSEKSTPLSDIYSAGVVFYEMLTGELPFDASSVYELVTKINNEVAPLVTNIRPTVSPSIAEFISRLLSRNPSDRPSANEAFKIIEKIYETTNWLEIEEDDKIHFEKIVTSKRLDIIKTEKDEKKKDDLIDLDNTIIGTKESAKPTGFFANDLSRFEEFSKSVDFFRSHMDKDYSSLLNQAKLSFWLWLGCVSIQ